MKIEHTCEVFNKPCKGINVLGDCKYSQHSCMAPYDFYYSNDTLYIKVRSWLVGSSAMKKLIASIYQNSKQ